MVAPKRIGVIGGGVIGLTSAYTLQARGHEVTVFEAAAEVAHGASWGNASLISAASAEAWASPSSLRAAIGWLFRADAPLKVHLGWDMERLAWLAKFAWAARSYEANTRALAQLSLAARAPLKAMTGAAGVAFDLAHQGVLDLYGSARERPHAQRLSRWLRQEGVEQSFLTTQELSTLEPELKKPFAFGVHTPADMTGCSQKFCTALARHLNIRLNTPVTALSARGEINGEAFDKVIVCAAYASRALAKPLGDNLPIYPVKGYSLTLQTAADAAVPRHGLLDHDGKVAVAPLGRRLRIGGTAEIGNMDPCLPEPRLRTLRTWVTTALPTLDPREATPWCGFRPMTSHIRPILQRSKASQHIIYNTGHGHLGWTLAAASAEQVAALI